MACPSRRQITRWRQTIQDRHRKEEDSPVVHIAYGDSLFALGQFGEAAQAIVKVWKSIPNTRRATSIAGIFTGNPSEFDSQLQTLEAYVSKNPADNNARFLLGYNYFFIQDYDRADEQLQAVLTNRYLHSSARYLHNLIQKYHSQKTQKSLKAAIRRYLRLNNWGRL